MLISILNKINEINEGLFASFDGVIENFGMPDWLCDAILDSFHILPLLFIVFFIIELIEFFYSEKIRKVSSANRKFSCNNSSMRIFGNRKYFIYQKIYHKRNFNRDLSCNIR